MGSKNPLEIFDNGAVLLVDKPAGWTSFDVVNKIRILSRAKKVGHCGTLDPFATGLLILCTGKATRAVDQFSALPKVYQCEFVFGKTTDTFDCEGQVLAEAPVGDYSTDFLSDLAKKFVGQIEQVPPAFSAIKIGGVAAYKLARKGKVPDLKARLIEITAFDILSYEKPVLRARISCSKGTYIRAVARDLGAMLGCGAFVQTLRREAIGGYTCREAATIEQIRETIHTLRTTNADTNRS